MKIKTILIGITLMFGALATKSQNLDTSANFLQKGNDFAIVKLYGSHDDWTITYSNLKIENIYEKLKSVSKFTEGTYQERMLICIKYMESIGYTLLATPSIANTMYSSCLFIKRKP